MLVHGRAHRRPRASARLHDLKCDVDERIFEGRVLEVVREDVSLVPARPLVAEAPHLAVCAGLGRVVPRSRNADAAGVEPLCVDAEGFAVAFGEGDGVVGGFFPGAPKGGVEGG
jgi:hypothetical protein